MGPYILGFFRAEAKLAVEIDGAGHGQEDQILHDERRDAWRNRKGVTVYRTMASTVFEYGDQVADALRPMADERIALRAAAPSTPRSSAGGPPPPLRVGGKG